MLKLKDLIPIQEKSLQEKAYVDMNAQFEVKGFGGNNIFIYLVVM